MTFLFFDQADAPLFERNDAERALWTVEEYRIEAQFPYLAGKAISRGMRIAFQDDTGIEQFFEIRKVVTYEPDHSQAIVAEHICVAELSDEHITRTEITNKTAAQALTTALTGTLWQVGNNTASGSQSADFAYGSVWDAVNTIQQNWNVYITPRVTWSAAGITGRYLDIAPASGTYRGVRLAIDKNADELGVTYDDTETLTALYGYGALGDDETVLNFGSVVWTAADDHPAKPAGQKYIEDPAATAAYGRNGRARFGYYQNNSITSASVLLQKTWEALQATNKPKVTVECTVCVLHRLGYADQPLQLHDTAIVDVSPIGVSLQLEIIKLDVDLLDPTQTRPVIGSYIPNIVYITRKAARAASGRGGGGGGARGKDTTDNSEWLTKIYADEKNIQLLAIHRITVDDILEQAGLSLDAHGVLVYADDNVNMWQSKLNVQSDRISLVVNGTGANASIKAAQIVASINDSGSTVIIDADKVDLGDYATVQSLSATNASISNLEAGLTTATHLKATALTSTYLWVNGNAASWQSDTVVTEVTQTKDYIAGGYEVVTNVSRTRKTIYYLGYTISS
jgi:phage minor structural protein